METLILEIQRIKSLMGLKEKPLLLEQINIFFKLFSQSDVVFKNVDDTKKFLNDINGSVTTKASKLTDIDIDLLARKLVDQTDEISSSIIKGSELGQLQTKYTAFNELVILLQKTNKLETDALLNLYVTKQLDNSFNKEGSFANRIYDQIYGETQANFKSITEVGSQYTMEEIINSFKASFEKKMKANGLLPKDYPELETWLKNKLLGAGEKNLDELIGKYKLGVNTAQGGGNLSSYWKVGDDTGKIVTDPKDIKKLSFSNLKLVQGIYNKLSENLRSMSTSVTNYEKNVALLRNYPVDQIIIDNKLSNQFRDLVQSISIDIEGLIKRQGDDLEEWARLLKELPDEIVQGINEVPIYEKVWGGFIFLEEKFPEFIKRISNESPSGFKKADLGEVTYKSIVERLNEAGTAAAKLDLAGMIKPVIRTNMTKIKRLIISQGLYGLPFTPKSLARMITKTGYGVSITQIKNYIVSYLFFVAYSQLYEVVSDVLIPTFEYLYNKVVPQGYRTATDDRGLPEVIKQNIADDFLTWGGLKDLLVPFEKGFAIEITERVYNGIIGYDWSRPVSEYQEKTESNYKLIWKGLSDTQKKMAIDSFNDAEKIKGSAFEKLSQYIGEDANFVYLLGNYPDLTNDDYKKLRSARVLIGQMETNEPKFTKGYVDSLVKDSSRLQQKLNLEFKVGGIMDKEGSYYEVIEKNNSMFYFKEITEPYEYYLQQDGSEYLIYQDDGTKAKDYGPITKENMELNDVKSKYSDKKEAEKIVKKLNKDKKTKSSKEISMVDMISKL